MFLRSGILVGISILSGTAEPSRCLVLAPQAHTSPLLVKAMLYELLQNTETRPCFGSFGTLAGTIAHYLLVLVVFPS
jgi:hypothetical protein